MKINLQYILQGCVKAIDRFNSFFFRYVFVQQKKGRKEYKKKRISSRLTLVKQIFSTSTSELLLLQVKEYFVLLFFFLCFVFLFLSFLVLFRFYIIGTIASPANNIYPPPFFLSREKRERKDKMLILRW